MIGGAISGYCATGSRENDTPPRITNTIETTAAKIGRSMKKCEMRIQETSIEVNLARAANSAKPPPPCGEGKFSSAGLGFVRPFGRRRAFLLRRHLLAWTCAHQAVDDDAIGGG